MMETIVDLYCFYATQTNGSGYRHVRYAPKGAANFHTSSQPLPCLATPERCQGIQQGVGC